MRIYEVGGCVRDALMGVATKDVDFVVIAKSYEEMRESLVAAGFKLWLEKPEFVTIRARVPAGSPLRARTQDADFVLARKDGPSSDGRRPDFVEAGTLEDDLKRRDFTVNAIAHDPIMGETFDPHHGVEDLQARVLRFVGEPMARIREDGLRVLRGLRFMVTKGFTPTVETWEALTSAESASMLACVSVERTREEVEKMCVANTLAALRLLGSLPAHTQEAIFRGGLRLSASLKA